MFSFLRAIATGEEISDRANAIRTDLPNGTIIDTCKAYDVGRWETGIKRGEGEWEIVERYDTQEEAKKGHDKWVNKIKEDPEINLEAEVEETMCEWAGIDL